MLHLLWGSRQPGKYQVKLWNKWSWGKKVHLLPICGGVKVIRQIQWRHCTSTNSRTFVHLVTFHSLFQSVHQSLQKVAMVWWSVPANSAHFCNFGQKLHNYEDWLKFVGTLQWLNKQIMVVVPGADCLGLQSFPNLNQVLCHNVHIKHSTHCLAATWP